MKTSSPAATATLLLTSLGLATSQLLPPPAFELREGYDDGKVAPIQNQHDVCTDFCKGAHSVCEGTVDWVTNTYSVPFSRHGQKGKSKCKDDADFRGNNMSDKHRDKVSCESLATKKKSVREKYCQLKDFKKNCPKTCKACPKYKPAKQVSACHDTCMGWVYWKSQAYPSFAAPEGRMSTLVDGFVVGDSLNCRYAHLMFASRFGPPNGPYGLAASESESATQHCQHVTDDGGWVCTDYRREEDGMTPGRLYKEATMSKHRLGDCFLAGDDKIADCHRKGLTDASAAQNLLWLPDDVEYIFLHLNRLTTIPDLSRFTKLRGVYLEDNNINALAADAFAANTELEIINLANNNIPELPAGTLNTTTKLKALYLNFNPIGAIPESLFANCPGIEMIALVNNLLTKFEPDTFKGLTSLKLLAFGQQGGTASPSPGMFRQTGIPAGLFDDLVSLEYFSMFFQGFFKLPKSMFGAWSAKIESFIIFFNALMTEIEDGVFDLMPSLIDFSAYSSGFHPNVGPREIVINPAEMANNTKLKHVLYGNSGVLPSANP